MLHMKQAEAQREEEPAKFEQSLESVGEPELRTFLEQLTAEQARNAAAQAETNAEYERRKTLVAARMETINNEGGASDGE